MSRQPTSQMAWGRHAGQVNFDERRLALHLEVTVRTLQLWWHGANAGPLEVWLQEQRVLRAVPLLELFGSVKEVAALSGYTQPASFCRQFKRCHGLTAGAYVVRFKARSPWWLDKGMLPQLRSLQSACRAHLAHRWD